MTAPDRLTILTYHSLDDTGSVVSISPSLFAQQMESLAEIGYRGISLGQALGDRRATGRWPERCVAITFDDGFANFHEHALPALSRHSFSATVFVVTGHVGGNNDWAPPPNGLGTQPMLSWSQIKELAETGIEIGAHTRTHPDLRKLSAEQLDTEIAGSVADIKEHVDKPIESFAYPYGYLSPAAASVAARLFHGAVTTQLARAGNDDPAQLPRVDTYYFKHLPAFRAVVQGDSDRYLAFRRWGRVAGRLIRAVIPRNSA